MQGANTVNEQAVKPQSLSQVRIKNKTRETARKERRLEGREENVIRAASGLGMDSSNSRQSDCSFLKMIKRHRSDEVSCNFCAVYQTSQSDQTQEAGDT